MIKLLDLLKENSPSNYDFGCAMLDFSFPEMDNIHQLIKKEDIYTEEGPQTYGLEDEPHCTLLYGLHKEVNVKEVEKALDKFTYYTCKIHNPSLFKNEKYDVLKFEVKGDNLKETNSELKKLPHTSNFPDYKPHLTIGYLKSGKGEKYVKLLKDKEMDEFELAPQQVTYSSPDNKKTKLNIKID